MMEASEKVEGRDGRDVYDECVPDSLTRHEEENDEESERDDGVKNEMRGCVKEGSDECGDALVREVVNEWETRVKKDVR